MPCFIHFIKEEVDVLKTGNEQTSIDIMDMEIREYMEGKGKFYCSKPVIALMDDRFLLASFLCKIENRDGKGRAIEKPFASAYFDFEEDVLYCIKPNEFQSMKDLSNLNAFQDRNYNQKCRELLLEICNSIYNSRIFDEKAYERYFEYMAGAVPDGLLDYYINLSIKTHQSPYTINADTLLPDYGCGRMDAKKKEDLINFYNQSEKLYILLSKDKARETEIWYESEPFAVCVSQNRIGFITTSYSVAMEVADFYGLYMDSIPLIGEIRMNDRYNNFVHAMKYMMATYADIVALGIYKESNQLKHMMACSPSDVLEYLGENTKDLSMLALENHATFHRTKKYQKWFAVMDVTGYQREIKGKKKEEGKCLTCEEFLSLQAVYILSNLDTGFPLLNRDGFAFIFSDYDTPMDVIGDLEQDFHTVLHITKLDKEHFSNTFYYLFCECGVSGVLLDYGASDIIFKGEQVCESPMEASFKKNMAVYMEMKKMGAGTEEIIETGTKLYQSVLEMKFFVPLTAQFHGELKPFQFESDKFGKGCHICPVFSNIEEFQSTGVACDEVMELNLCDTGFDCHKIIIDISGKMSLVADRKMLWNMNQLYGLCKNYLSSYCISMSDELAGECIEVLKNRAFRKTKCAKVCGYTAERFCNEHKVTALNAYYYLSLILINKEFGLKKIKEELNATI